MPAVVGMRGTGSWSSDERPKNYREVILRLYPHGKATLMALLGVLKERTTDDPEFKIFQKLLPIQRTTVSGSYNNTDNPVTISIPSGDETYFKPGHVIMNLNSGEVMWVTNASTPGQLICYRPHTKASGSNGNQLLIIGSAYEEGADAPGQITYDPVVVTNYCQIFRTAVAMTRTARLTRLRTGDQVKEAQREALLLHNIEMEKAFWFGQAKEVLTGDQPKRTTKGIYNFLSSNIKNYSSGLSIDTWENDLEDIFRYGSNKKLLIAGARFLNCMNKLARKNSTVMLYPKDETYGLNIWSYVTPFGELAMMLHPLFSENPILNTWGFILDTENLVYRPLVDSDTKYLRNRQGPGVDGVKDEYLTEAGLELAFEQTHAVCMNLSTIVTG